MRGKKRNFLLAVTLVTVGLLLLSTNIGSVSGKNDNENLGFSIKPVNVEIKTMQRPKSELDLEPERIIRTFGAPEFTFDGNQTHPAIDVAGWDGYMAAFADENYGLILTYTNDDGVSFGTGGDYPSIKRWDGQRFFGTFVPDSNDSYGGIVYLFETTDNQNFDSYTLSGWDWSELPDFPDQILWHDIIDMEIACDDSKELWEWGFISFVGSTEYDEPIVNAPFVTYQTSFDGYATISWYLLEGCAHTDNFIDHTTLYGYSVYDFYDTELNAWTLFLRKDNYGDWAEESVGYQYYSDEGGNLEYPAVCADNGNLVLISESDENGNKDIVCFYGDQLETLEDNTVVGSEDDERFPDVQHYKDDIYICTFVKNNELYAVVTENAGETWGEPYILSDGTGSVEEEYGTADLTQEALYAMWEQIDIDMNIWRGVAIDNNPPAAPEITAPEEGKEGEDVEFTFSAYDSDGEDVEVMIEWGDGSGQIVGPYQSGEEFVLTHSWPEQKTYQVRAKAKDTNDLIGPWSSTDIEIPAGKSKEKNIQWLFLRNILDRFPILRQMLMMYL